jgi:hypothetical protein
MAKIISGFPGIGKTTLYEVGHNHLKIMECRIDDINKSNVSLDLISYNYIDHILQIYDQYDVILVNSHKVIRQQLISNNISFYLVYPSLDLKSSYIKRYIDRDVDYNIIKQLDDNYIDWVMDCTKEPINYQYKYCLFESWETIYNVIDDIIV